MPESGLRPFHLAFPVNDLSAARQFYGELLGCREGRSSDQWVDFDFFGHQIVAHLAPELCTPATANSVDGQNVPVRHFGIVLTLEDWSALAEKLKAAGTEFLIEPYTRFKGQPGEQATMFFEDPFQNALEFKAYQNPSEVFSK